MIPKSMLLGMLKPLLPKLEGFLKNHENLKDGEKAKIQMDIVDDKLDIKIIACKLVEKDTPRLTDEVIISKILSEVDPKEL
tara:strand:- start:6273 stop:6515 length:243 start_codon:yes stop_codon:yes gene_type:complete